MSTRFYLGGCRSGKSRLAEQWVRQQGQSPLYIATLQGGGEEEMERRIAQHRLSRGDGWLLREEPLLLSEAVIAGQDQADIILVDCLTLWLTNMLLADMVDQDIESRVHGLCEAIAQCAVPLVLVANEVGLGIVPESSLARRFRDLAGWTNQQVAGCCQQVIFVAAGLPMVLKGHG